MKIILIGFMGAGKTSVGKKLAEKLELAYVDMDQLIITQSGRTSDSEIFDQDGEVFFRELETAVAKDLQKIKDAIIATGGGIVLNKLNIDYLKNDGVVVFLKNSFETSQKRINNNHIPPLFRDGEKAKALYDFRLPLYIHYADVIIETDNKTIEHVTNEIMEKIKNL